MSIINSRGYFDIKVITVRWYYDGARVVEDCYHPASCCLSKERQVNPEGALAVRTDNKDYTWDMMWCSHSEID